MKNIIWIVILVIVIILIALLSAGKKADNLEVNSPTEDKTVDTTFGTENTPPPNTGNSSTATGTSTTQTSGSYESYSPDKIARANNGDVVLFFRASWCPTCRTLDKDIRANISNIPTGTTILDVNYDTEIALKQKYGVTYQHTLVQVDASGNMIAKWTGSPTLTSLLSSIK